MAVRKSSPEPELRWPRFPLTAVHLPAAEQARPPAPGSRVYSHQQWPQYWIVIEPDGSQWMAPARAGAWPERGLYTGTRAELHTVATSDAWCLSRLTAVPARLVERAEAAPARAPVEPAAGNTGADTAPEREEERSS